MSYSRFYFYHSEMGKYWVKNRLEFKKLLQHNAYSVQRLHGGDLIKLKSETLHSSIKPYISKGIPIFKLRIHAHLYIHLVPIGVNYGVRGVWCTQCAVRTYTPASFPDFAEK